MIPRAGAVTRRIGALPVSALLSAMLLLAPAGVRADELAPEPAAVESRVEWSATWPRFRRSEYVATAGIAATSLYVRLNRPPPEQARWQGNNFFDDAVRGWLRADTLEGRASAVKISDWVSLAGTAVPFAIDLPVVLFAHRQPQVTWQLLMMDIEANAVAGLLNNVLFYAVGRGRPSSGDCARDPGYDPLCGGSANNASFPSGHTLTIATAAGLTCVHHRYLPIYGSPAADAGGCVLMSLATAITAAARIVADRHYATDDLIGAAIGFGSGYALPRLLHYRSPADSAGKDKEATGQRLGLVPFGNRAGLGLGLLGTL